MYLIIGLLLLILLGIIVFLVASSQDCLESLEGPYFSELTTMVNNKATVDIELNTGGGWLCPAREQYDLKIIYSD